MSSKLRRVLSALLCAVMLFGLVPGAALAAQLETTPMYRLYNPNSGEHFYTGSIEERDGLDEIGWNYEGIAWDAPIVGEPVYRVYNPNSGDHHYTMDATERDWLVSLGWKDENVAWNSAPDNGIPVFRLWNPNADLGSHHYTNSEEERDWLVGLGWIFEGIGWYGVKAEDIKVTLKLTASHTELTAKEKTTVYFYAAVTGNVGKVQLMNSADNSVVLELKDDGLYGTSGDDLPNDSIYSGKYVIDAKADAQYSFYASASNAKSEKVQLKVVSGFTETQIQQMEEVDLTIQDDIFEAAGYAEMTDEQKQDLAETVLEDLSEQGLVDEDTIYHDETNDAYTFMYESGALGAVILKDWAEDRDGFGTRKESMTAEQETVAEEVPVQQEEPVAEEPVEQETQPTEETEAVAEEITEEAVLAETSENPYEQLWQERMEANGIAVEAFGADTSAQPTAIGEAIVLWSFEQAWDDPTFRVPFYETMEDEFDALGLETTVDWDTTVNDYKNLSGYEVIMFSGHGAYETYEIWTGPFTKEKQTLSSLLLYEKSTNKKDKTYENDLKQFRVGKISVQGGTMYAILPNFFTHYYNEGDLDGSFVFIQDCESHGKDGNENFRFSDALRAASAEAVVGYHNSVESNYGRGLMKTYITNLINGDTAGTAYNKAVQTHGATDGYIAYPLFRGDQNAVLVGSDIVNGNFEDNATSAVGWKQVGDTRILTQLSSLTPPSKQRMAILTTGIGSAEEEYVAGTEGSVLSQVFSIPKGKTKLVFTYDVVSEEPEEFVGSSFNDTFLAQITVDGKTEVMAKEQINTSKWYSISGINFDGGDNTTYHTQWKTVEFDVSAYAGKTVNLQFVVYDVGDSIYDTAALVDNVYLK